MRLRVATAGGGEGWEADFVLACQHGTAPAEIVQRCFDLGDLLAVAVAGRARVALVSAGLRWLDREAVTRLADAGLTVIGVAPGDDEPAELRLRQLGLAAVVMAHDPPDRIVAVATMATLAGSSADDDPGIPSSLEVRPAEPPAPGPGILDLPASRALPASPDQPPAPPSRPAPGPARREASGESGDRPAPLVTPSSAQHPAPPARQPPQGPIPGRRLALTGRRPPPGPGRRRHGIPSCPRSRIWTSRAPTGLPLSCTPGPLRSRPSWTGHGRPDPAGPGTTPGTAPSAR